MSDLNSRAAIITSLQTAVDSSDIAYESLDFDWSDKDTWVDFYFTTTSDEPTAKGQNDLNRLDGYFQVGIYSRLKEKIIVDAIVMGIKDDITNVFFNNSVHTYNGQNTTITGSDVEHGESDGGYWKRILTVEFFSEYKRA